MFIATAFAQGASGGSGGVMGLGSIEQIAPLVLIFVVFYFLLIRPQQKKAKDHKSMLGALRRGDKVVTGGGIIGTVSKLQGDDEVLVEVAEGVRLRVLRGTIQSVISRTEPAPEKAPAGDGDKK